MLHHGHIDENFSANMPHWGHIDVGTLKMNPDLAQLNIEEMLERSDLAFQVGTVQTGYDYLGVRYPSKAYSIIRLDSGEELGRGASSEYNPMSYLDSLGAIFGDVKQLGGIPTRVIKFGKGERAAIQFILPEDYKAGGKQHKLFFNVYGSHDRTQGIGFNSSDICVVCGNTYAASLASALLRNFVKHTVNAGSKLAELAQTVLAVKRDAHIYYTLLDRAATVKADNAAQQAFIAAMFPDTGGGEKRQNKAADNRRGELMEAIKVSQAEREGYLTNSVPTIYDLFSGVTRFTSHKTQKRNEAEQFDYVTEGPGAKLNDKAYNWLVEAVK